MGSGVGEDHRQAGHHRAQSRRQRHVYDARIGDPGAADDVRLNLFMYLLPRSNDGRWRRTKPDGCVLYVDGTDEIDEGFRERVSVVVRQIASEESARYAPGPSECGRCLLVRTAARGSRLGPVPQMVIVPVVLPASASRGSKGARIWSVWAHERRRCLFQELRVSPARVGPPENGRSAALLRTRFQRDWLEVGPRGTAGEYPQTPFLEPATKTPPEIGVSKKHAF